MTRRPINYGGKPYRVLLVLHRAGPSNPQAEADIWRALKDTENTSKFYHGALKKLVDLGFAEKHGTRGRQHFTITTAGSAYIIMDGRHKS